MVIAYVGSGGKTTLIKRHAQEYLRMGLRVLVTTSTHMYIEEDTLLTARARPIIRRLEEDGFAMAGTPQGEKIGPLPNDVYLEACAHADMVLVEADGSRGLPLKFPGRAEPVIPENADKIIVVCGLRALGQRAKEVCHRLELAKEQLDIRDDTIITAGHIRQLLEKGYILPLRKAHPGKEIAIHAVHDQSVAQLLAAREIESLLHE